MLILRLSITVLSYLTTRLINLSMKIPYYKIFAIIISLFAVLEVIGIDDKDYRLEKRIILQEGLSQNRILSILEDDFGFMWFGTADGLNRYDGYHTQVFRNKYGDSTSLSNNTINAIVKDKSGNFWIGTSNGISYFNPYSKTSTNFFETDSLAVALGANIITSCVIDKDENIWFGTDGYGIIKINASSLIREYFFYGEKDSLLINSIKSLYIDSKNKLWIGSYIDNVIKFYDINNGKLNSIEISKEKSSTKYSKRVLSFYEDSKGRVWTCVLDDNDLDGGIYFYDNNKNEYHSYNEYLDPHYREVYYDSYNTIISITGDSSGNIWFGSMLSGIFQFQFGETPVAYYVNSPVVDSRINCIYLSNNGILWIGTNGSGVEISIPANTNFNIISKSSESEFDIESIRSVIEGKNNYWVGGYYGLAKISKDFKSIKTVHDASVYSLAVIDDYPDYIWSGSEGGGLSLFNIVTEEYEKFKLNENDKNGPLLKFIYVIYPLNDSLVLLGTENGLFGINKSNNNTYRFSFNYLANIKSEAGIAVRTIYTDNNNNVLIGYVQGGVGLLDLKNKSVNTFKTFPDFKDFSNFNPVNCIYHDKSDIYWLATSNGLLELSQDKKTFVLITETNGLPNSHIYSILPDNEDNLWMSTNNGLSCFSNTEHVFRNYDITDGLQNNEFNTGAYLKASNGNLFFGGIHGFNYFDPALIKQNSIIPKLAITGVKIANNYLMLSKKELENANLYIPSDSDVFTIEFAGLSYINSEKNTYKYKIKQLSNEWINLNHQTEITFYGMAPGTYNLEILASNNHGLGLNNPFEFRIIVQPKFYESNIFRWLMTFMVIILIIVGIFIRDRRITQQKDKLQQLVDEQTSKLKETNKDLSKEITKHSETAKALVKSISTKDRFLSIIAHDTMGPLGVIQGFSDILIENGDEFPEEEKITFYKTINSTVRQLSSLLTNLLQWSRIQNKTIDPHLTEINVLETLEEVLSLLLGNINEKDINLIINVDKNGRAIADGNMLQTIFRNLISNAIKFTPENGRIAINSMQKKDNLELSVSDTGIGIKEEDISKLFNSEQNFTTKGTNNEPGTGLGLNLVHEFVQLIGGKLWVRSEVGRGTTFYFTLPIQK